MGCMATRKRTVKRNGKVYKYELETPRRYYKCYGVQHFRTGCREHTMIRAERLEGLVWGEVKKVMENPDIIVAGIESLDSQEGEGLDEQIAGTERELQKVQFEEDRAIRLYVSEKITEEQLDRQRKFITERLETLRARLADYRAKETASIEKRALGEHVVEWANRVGDGLDDLPQEKRRDVLRLLLDEVTIDGENNVNLTLAVPTEELVLDHRYQILAVEFVHGLNDGLKEPAGGGVIGLLRDGHHANAPAPQHGLEGDGVYRDFFME